MRSQPFASCASALLLLSTLAEAGHDAHERLELIHRRHREDRARSIAETAETGIAQEQSLEKRGGQCQFPTGAGLVAVTPNLQNAGWAMSPDQPCTPGNYCPYACPPGQVSMQWDPSATTYSYPKSMNGGLYCDSNGNMQKPFPDRPYCQSTAANVGVTNNCNDVVSFCQTVLPGNEAMLIPTLVNDYATLAMPDTSYWAGTAAHYYINPPGVHTDEACVWGSNQKGVGNWAPYVAGGNVDASGNTFIKLGWNPIWLEPTTPFRNTMPSWGVKIECPNGGCNGLPCAIDPTQNSVNQMVGSQSDGAGGGAFCVVTVAKGSSANFVVFQPGVDSSNKKGAQFYQSSAASTAAASTTTTVASTTSSSASSATTWSAWNNTAPASTTGWYPSNSTSSTSYGGSASQTANTTFTSPSMLPATGDASKFGMGAFGLILVAWLL